MSAVEKRILEADLTMAFIDFDIHMLRHYLEETESQLQKAKADEISAYCEALRVQNKAKRGEADVHLQAAEEQAIAEKHEEFLRFQRYAFLMLTLMIFEARAKELCNYVRDGKQLSLSVGDLRGDFSERLKLYLCRCAMVLDEKWPLWQDLRELQRIRNQIAHEGGVCGEEQAKKLKALARRVCGLRLESDFGGLRIELNSDTCRYAVSTIASFFEEAGRKAGFRSGG